jgi:hypothetical protein
MQEHEDLHDDGSSRSVLEPPLDPDAADTAPSDPMLTPYDYEHLITYLRILDAEAESADWREVALIVLHIDPVANRSGHAGLAKATCHALSG